MCRSEETWGSSPVLLVGCDLEQIIEPLDFRLLPL